MNSFNPFAMCYQFWMMPNFVPARRPYYPPVTFFPQMLNTQVNNLIIQNMVPVESKSLPQLPPKTAQNLEPRPADPEP